MFKYFYEQKGNENTKDNNKFFLAFVNANI